MRIEQPEGAALDPLAGRRILVGISGSIAAVKLPFLVGSPDGRTRLWAALRFLIPLGVGIAISYYLATKLLVGATDSPGLLRRPGTAPW